MSDLLSRSFAHIKNETNSHQERHNFPNFALSASNRKALGKRGNALSKCPLGWDPVAAGNRAGDGMACNDSDRRQWRMQGTVVGAAASKTQA